MLINTILSYILVGVFYATYSIFVRAVFPEKKDVGIAIANVLENIYLVFLFLIVLLSISLKLDWAEKGF